jgi:hypothetical protein
MIRVVITEVSKDYSKARTVLYREYPTTAVFSETPDSIIIQSVADHIEYAARILRKEEAAAKGSVVHSEEQEADAPQAQESHPQDEPASRAAESGIPRPEMDMEKSPRKQDLPLLSKTSVGAPPLTGENRRTVE